VSRGILLVDHGSRRAEANENLEVLAEEIRARSPGQVVHVAHLEIASPTIAEGIDACVADGVDDLVVHPYFLGPGHHTTHDIPDRVASACAGHATLRVCISEPLGLHPGVLEAILDRIGSARS
jgi:sirohydrochlorin ferrochelatase